MRWVVAALALALAGCAPTAFNNDEGATAGGASYKLNKGPDGSCTVSAVSGREVHGASVTIHGETCSAVIGIEATESVTMSAETLMKFLGGGL